MRIALVASPFRLLFLTLCLVLWSLVPATAQVERGPVQPRPGPSPVVPADSPDMQPAIRGAGLVQPGEIILGADIPGSEVGIARMDKEISAYVPTGGDDVLMFSHPDGTYAGIRSTAFDSDGNGYFAMGVNSPTDKWVEVRRSTDGGLTWPVWGTVPAPGTPGGTAGVNIIIAEGYEDRCYLAFHKWSGAGDYHIVVLYAELSTSSPVFTEVAAIESPGEDILYPSLATDAANFDGYFLYLTARSRGDDHDKIWFTRSIDQGATWETEYTIAELAAVDRDYMSPQIAYGFSAKIHVVWEFKDWSGTLDGAIRYKSADDYAQDGAASWGAIQYLTPNTDGRDDFDPLIACSPSGNEVLIAYESRIPLTAPDVKVMDSADLGATWSTSRVMSSLSSAQNVIWQPSTDSWILSSRGYGMMFQRASTSSPTVWTDPQYFWDGPTDGRVGGGPSGVTLNPAKGDRVGAFWFDTLDPGGSNWLFDAEWFTDSGWPVEEPESPVALSNAPRTAPAVVDLDGDGDLEIIFTDDADQVVALHHDGTSVAGWPVVPGSPLSGSPVAVGDLNEDGKLEVAVGTANGEVYLYDPSGILFPGWPLLTNDPMEVHVSIGALGPPYHRVVVACAGRHAEAYNYGGRVPPGYNFPQTTENLRHPAAIGDVDGDGLNDLVLAGTSWIAAYHPGASSAAFGRTLPDIISDAPSLGDLDSDGDVEILVPTLNGRMYAIQGDATDVTGWPFDTGEGYRLSSAAVANCLGTGDPEIAFASENYKVFLTYNDGDPAIGYPVNTGTGWYIWADPVIGILEGSSPDIIIGARDENIWSWNNFGTLLGGWPRAASDNVHQTVALGDLDLDGNTEVVILDESQMMILDVHSPMGAAWGTWAMQGHDPQRTGCWDCPEDFTSAVDDPASSGLTRVSFAMESANPASGQAQFSLSLPERAVVAVDVFDVRGHRVRTVLRAEVPAGTHLVGWDGRDGAGRAVSSGQYLMRLTARGPQTDEHMVRKVTWLR